jgi:hypothetical protein
MLYNIVNMYKINAMVHHGEYDIQNIHGLSWVHKTQFSPQLAQK